MEALKAADRYGPEDQISVQFANAAKRPQPPHQLQGEETRSTELQAMSVPCRPGDW